VGLDWNWREGYLLMDYLFVVADFEGNYLRSSPSQRVE
jgi:hypothetical protein